MYRIILKEKGFVIQKLTPKWSLFGIKYKWETYSFYRGSSDVFYYSTYESALMCHVINIKDQILDLSLMNI